MFVTIDYLTLINVTQTDQIIERFDNIQDDIEKELNSFQDLLMKKD